MGLFLHGHQELSVEITIVLGDLIQHASQLVVLLVQSLQLHPEHPHLITNQSKAQTFLSALGHFESRD